MTAPVPDDATVADDALTQWDEEANELEDRELRRALERGEAGEPDRALTLDEQVELVRREEHETRGLLLGLAAASSDDEEEEQQHPGARSRTGPPTGTVVDMGPGCTARLLGVDGARLALAEQRSVDEESLRRLGLGDAIMLHGARGTCLLRVPDVAETSATSLATVCFPEHRSGIIGLIHHQTRGPVAVRLRLADALTMRQELQVFQVRRDGSGGQRALEFVEPAFATLDLGATSQRIFLDPTSGRLAWQRSGAPDEVAVARFDARTVGEGRRALVPGADFVVTHLPDFRALQDARGGLLLFRSLVPPDPDPIKAIAIAGSGFLDAPAFLVATMEDPVATTHTIRASSVALTAFGLVVVNAESSWDVFVVTEMGSDPDAPNHLGLRPRRTIPRPEGLVTDEKFLPLTCVTAFGHIVELSESDVKGVPYATGPSRAVVAHLCTTDGRGRELRPPPPAFATTTTDDD